MQILDVLDAKTAAEFRARARALPVRIVTTAGISNGREGVWKEYRHGRGLTFRRFVPHSPMVSVASTGQASNGMLSTEDSPSATEADPIVWNNPLKGARESLDECEFVDLDGIVWIDECATLEDIDAETAVVVAMEAEVAASRAQTNAAIGDMCMTLYPYDSADEEELCEYMTLARSGAESHVINVFSEQDAAPLDDTDGLAFSNAAICIDPGVSAVDGEAHTVAMNCVAEGLTSLASLVGFGAAGLRFWDAAASIGRVTRLAIASASLAYVATGVAVVAAGYVLLECLY